MPAKYLYILFLLPLLTPNFATAQQPQIQQGILFKYSTALRLGNVKLVNKRTNTTALTGIYGTFHIKATSGDTLEFTSDTYQSQTFVVTDFADAIVYLQPATELKEVVVKANSIKADLAETQQVYRSKGVFYTGEPHYYYLFLKPMTFIYENFKSEVKNARKFRKYVRRETAAYEVAKRYNNVTIKNAVPAISDLEIAEFKVTYAPSLSVLNIWSDYDLITYIQRSYQDYKSKKH